jgi:hypothetical protein
MGFVLRVVAFTKTPGAFWLFALAPLVQVWSAVGRAVLAHDGAPEPVSSGDGFIPVPLAFGFAFGQLRHQVPFGGWQGDFSAALLTAEETHSRGIEFEGKSLSDTLPSFYQIRCNRQAFGNGYRESVIKLIAESSCSRTYGNDRCGS